MPVMRPLWMEFPADEKTFAMSDQWLVGSDLLVHPVVERGATKADVYFPGADGQLWYDVASFKAIKAPRRLLVDAPIDHIPVYQRGGAIVPRKMRLRRASKLMVHDPYTLVVAPTADGAASGELYLDDEHTYDYASEGKWKRVRFEYASGVLRASTTAEGDAGFDAANTVERVVIAGVAEPPRAVTVQAAGEAPREISFVHDLARQVLTLRKPDVLVALEWTITLQAAEE